MGTESYRKRLLDEERELQTQLARLEGEARDRDAGEVQDAADEATAAQSTEESLSESSRLSATLMQVRDALQRLQAGTYGICVVCGRPIEPGRLQAVPWSPYCLADQEKLETRTVERHAGSTL